MAGGVAKLPRRGPRRLSRAAALFLDEFARPSRQLTALGLVPPSRRLLLSPQTHLAIVCIQRHRAKLLSEKHISFWLTKNISVAGPPGGLKKERESARCLPRDGIIDLKPNIQVCETALMLLIEKHIRGNTPGRLKKSKGKHNGKGGGRDDPIVRTCMRAQARKSVASYATDRKRSGDYSRPKDNRCKFACP